jgi:hypothetical protein
MALPGNNPNAITDAVAAEIKVAAAKDLAALPDLQAEDLALFGTLVQYFAFMDFNLRRALETFYSQKMIPKEYAKLWPDSLPDSKLTEALGAIIKGMDLEKAKIDEALVWLQVIDSTRLKRNLVSHFAGKRHNGHDVYVFVSKSYKDAKKVFGAGLAQHEAHFVVTPRTEFAQMVEAAKNAHEWLGKKVPEWNERYLAKKPAQTGTVKQV